MNDTAKLADDLLTSWLYQKSLAMKRAGLDPKVMSWDRAKSVAGPTMEKLAKLIEAWDVSPGLLMEAVFTAARKKGHRQGPYLNQLLGDRFIRQSLADLLDVPMELVLRKIKRSEIIAAIDKDYQRQCPSLLEMSLRSEASLLFATSYSASYRFYLAFTAGCKEDLRVLALDTISEVEADHRMLMWLESRGITFDTLAKVANAAQAGGVFVHQAALDAIEAAVKLIKQDKAAAGNKSAAACYASAAAILRKAADMLETK